MLPTDRDPLLDSDERSDDVGDDAAGAQAAAAQVKTEAQARAEAAPREASMAEAMAEPKRTSPGKIRGDAKEPAVASTAQTKHHLSPPPPPGKVPKIEEGKVTTETNESACFKHGLVDFAATGTRAKYLIVPADCEDDLAVLRAACRAWGLSLPNLVVSVQGGQTCPENWWYWLSDNNNVWTSDIEGNDDKAVFNDSVKQLYVGVAKACAESKAWVYSWNDCIGGVDLGFEGKTELFGEARRSAGLKDDAVVHLAAFHQGGSGSSESGGRSGRGDLPLWGFDRYNALAGDLPKDETKPVEEPKGVVKVPKMKDHYCQFRDHLDDPKRKYMHFEPNGLPGSGAKASGLHAKKVPQGQVTHLILHEEGCRLPRNSILKALQKLIPCPVLVANGRKHLLPIWVQESHENPVIILSNTGGAADVLAEAVRCSRQAGSRQSKQATLNFNVPTEEESSFPMSHTLSKGARESQFVVLDAHQDTTERVVDRLIQCMSVVDDEETRSLGFHRLELERLQAAWGLFLCIVAATLEPK